VHKGKSSMTLRLWRREWENKPWEVFVRWDNATTSDKGGRKGGGGGLDGKVVCLWSDANDPKTIPAFEEVRMFMPVWSIATKLSEGLVEGSKVFQV